jgi:putative ABC transport system substrate-binding protein
MVFDNFFRVPHTVKRINSFEVIPKQIIKSKVWLWCLLSILVWSVNSPLAAASANISWMVFSDVNKHNWSGRIESHTPSRLYVKSNAEVADSTPKKILVIVAKKSGSYKLALNKLLEVFFQEKYAAEFEVVNIAGSETVGLALLTQAQSQGFDLVFTMGSEAAALVHKYYTNGPLPVVTSINKDPVTLGQVNSYTAGSGTNIATTTLNVPIDIQLNYLFQLNPKLKHVALLYNHNHKQVVATEVKPFRKAMIAQGIRVIDVTVESRDKAREQLEKSLPEAMDLLREIDPTLNNSLVWVTSSTAIFSNLDIVSQYSKGVALVSTNPNAVKAGGESAVVAIGIDRRNNAHLAAIYALRILRDKENPGDLEVGVVTPPDIALNFKVARELGLKIPFTFLEGASFVYDYHGELVRSFGQNVRP